MRGVCSSTWFTKPHHHAIVYLLKENGSQLLAFALIEEHLSYGPVFLSHLSNAIRDRSNRGVVIVVVGRARGIDVTEVVGVARVNRATIANFLFYFTIPLLVHISPCLNDFFGFHHQLTPILYAFCWQLINLCAKVNISK